MGRLTRRQDNVDASDTYADPYSYPPAATSSATGLDDYPPYGTASTDAFIGRDQAIPGGRRPTGTSKLTNTYPPHNDDYAFEKGGNPVNRGSIAAQLAAEGQIPKEEGLRIWRSDEHKGAFTKGGRGRCCGRMFCCVLILAVIILVSIVSAFFLWVKPPEVSFNGIEAPSQGSQVNVISNGFTINLRLNVGVINPNFFGAKFSKIAAQAYYPTKPNVQFGEGELQDVEIKKNSNTTIRFPFQVNYTTTYDPDLSVLKDIASKCGFLTTGATSAVGDLKVNYRLRLQLKVLSLSISPSFSSSASFACPLSESDISGLLNDAGITGLSDVTSALGGGTRQRLRRALSTADDADVEADLARKRQALHESVLSLVMERGLHPVPAIDAFF